MSLFLNENLEMRPGWRFATYTLAYVLVLMLSGAVMSELVAGPVEVGQPRGLALVVLTFLPPAVLAFVFMLRFVERAPRTAFGVTLHEGWSRDLSVGLVIAAGMVLIYAASAGLLAGIGPPGGPAHSQETIPWGNVALTVVLLAVAAGSEELVYRGYPLQALMEATGPSPIPAVLAMSALFGLGHHLNPNATWLGTFNTFLAGILLSIAYLRTRSLWLPYGLHLGWNLGTGVLLGLPVSGVRLSSLRDLGVGGPRWLTGGEFGPEGGILVTIAIIAAAVFTGTTPRLGISPSIRAARGGDRGG